MSDERTRPTDARARSERRRSGRKYLPALLAVAVVLVLVILGARRREVPALEPPF